MTDERKVIEFSSKSVEYGFLSNFYESQFMFNGLPWMSVERFFQAQKFPGDLELQEKIRLSTSSAKAKQLGKTKSMHFRKDWPLIREDIMLQGLLRKFEQNPQLAQKLLATGNAELKEAAFWDGFWGLGRNGKGQNRMGHLLMYVREKLNPSSF
jgi:ribA/ribD-fused uncharacterized protein